MLSPQTLEMAKYLQSLGYKCSEKLKEEEIQRIYNIIFGTHEERKKRLKEGADCFGDYVEEIKKDCYFNDGICCAMLGPCTVVTEIQRKSEKADAKKE